MTILQVGAIPAPKMGVLDVTFRLFLRIVALGFLVMALQSWGGLIGYSDGGLRRFDQLPPHWQVASASLAVVLPVAALGLWMEAAWGAVIWVVAAGGQVAMHQLFPHWYGERSLLMMLHMVVAATYVAFRIAFLIRGRERARQVSSDSL